MPSSKGLRSFSDQLMEAATRLDELDRDDVARLLMKAAIRLRVLQHVEHIPVEAYHLLRRISLGALPVATLHGREDEATLHFLISRQLVDLSADGQTVSITVAGNELGEVAAEVAV